MKLICVGCSKVYERGTVGGRVKLSVCSDECRIKYYSMMLGGPWLGPGFCSICNKPTLISYLGKPKVCCGIECQMIRIELKIVERRLKTQTR